MRPLAEAWDELADEPGPAMAEPRAGDGGIAGYDAWKLATPPGYAEDLAAPSYALARLPEGACGRVTWPFSCARPYGHLTRGEGPCCANDNGKDDR